MSVGASPVEEAAPGRLRELTARTFVALAALVLVAGGVALVLALTGGFGAAPPPKNPFGMGVREAAPGPGGLGAFILALQSGFYRSLQAAVAEMKASGSGFAALVAVGLAYGVFHAAGPGHGKAVISAYLLANERALRRGFALSLAAALLQAFVAIAIVGVAALALGATAASMSRTVTVVETASFAAIAAVGVLMTWRKAGKFLGALGRAPSGSNRACGPDECGHVLMPPPAAVERAGRFREMAGIVLAAGLRPCAGAIVVLVFALSQNLFAAGIAATLAMALGTALTTGAAAAIAVFAKGLALRVAGGRGTGGAVAVAGLELLAAAFVLVLGAALLFGMSAAAGS